MFRSKTGPQTRHYKSGHRNTRSAGVEVAVIAKYFLANTANVGILHAFTFHHSRGDDSRGYCCCLKKSLTSSCTGSESSMLLPGKSLPRSRSKAFGRSSTSFLAVVVSISCVFEALATVGKELIKRGGMQ